MFCPQCGTEVTVAARFCMKCGQPIVNDSASQASPERIPDSVDPKFTQPTIPSKPRWYEGRWNVIGIAVLSFFLYSYVLMATLAGATLRGNEAIYIALWTSVVFYVIWKRKGWRGWVGALVGCFAGFVFVFLAAAVSGLNR